MFLFFDVETTGIPKNWKAPMTDTSNWPYVVQIAWQLYDKNRTLLEVQDHIIKPEGWEIPYASEKVHKISTERAKKEGKELKLVLDIFKKAIDQTEYVIARRVEPDNINGQSLRSYIKNSSAKNSMVHIMH